MMQCKQRDVSERFLHSLKAQCGLRKSYRAACVIACNKKRVWKYASKALRGPLGRVRFAADNSGSSSTRFAMMAGVRGWVIARTDVVANQVA
jgi:hypothetical protein